MLSLGTMGFISWPLMCGYVLVVVLRILCEGVFLNRWQNRPLERYLILQIVTVASLMAVWRFAQPVAVHGWYAECEGVALGILGRAGERLRLHPTSALIVLSTYLFMIDGGARLVRGILDKFPLLMERVAATVKTDGENRGEWIGVLERIIALTFVLTGNYTAVAFVLTAKSIARFKELDNKDFAEYYLLGTSTSVAIALLAGSLVRLFL